MSKVSFFELKVGYTYKTIDNFENICTWWCFKVISPISRNDKMKFHTREIVPVTCECKIRSCVTNFIHVISHKYETSKETTLYYRCIWAELQRRLSS